MIFVSCTSTISEKPKAIQWFVWDWCQESMTNLRLFIVFVGLTSTNNEQPKVIQWLVYVEHSKSMKNIRLFNGLLSVLRQQSMRSLKLFNAWCRIDVKNRWQT